MGNKPTKRRLMIDLETTALSCDAGVWQIGCQEVGGGYNDLILMDPYRQENRKISPITITWLEEHSPDWTRSLEVFGTLAPTPDVLSRWAKKIKSLQIDEVWCKGADIDFAILRGLLRDNNIHLPWSYKNQCCMRSFLNTFPEHKVKIDRHRAHNALNDAKAQSDCLINILQQLGKY